MSGLEHYDQELFDLEKRIRRLAISCDIDISDKNVIISIIKGNYNDCKNKNNPKKDELRGLLMLKYDIQENCLDSIGVNECFDIVKQVDEKLHKCGFPDK